MDKVYKSGDYEASHENPVWQNKANFIIAAHLGEKDGQNEWEQIWAHRLDNTKFYICCIPFFSFDLALGDEVETNDNYVIQRVIKPSGQYTFRVWFGNSFNPLIKDIVIQDVRQLNVEIEWSSENLLAVSASDAIQAQKLAAYLYSKQNMGELVYESGRSI